ncbi:hypothetical protein BMF94_1436 [Rhodotorula taiwanensis]|uniref:Glycosyltransferase 61 catalytic domain-containing protein n=1 Tax=Rhodotorula taiwanensis TaxID=741276 RepID=A0A2S5BFK6_9BASI|nr:hypothetical protein BMF94_1436 [Rhodotorula taiwanensis]
MSKNHVSLQSSRHLGGLALRESLTGSSATLLSSDAMTRPASSPAYSSLSQPTRALFRTHAARIATLGVAATLLVTLIAHVGSARGPALPTFARIFSSRPRSVPPGHFRRKSVPPQRRRIGDSVYSSNRCIGAAHLGPNLDATRCHFENVCIELQAINRQAQQYSYASDWQPHQSVKMTYYRPPVARDTPHYSNRQHDIQRPWVRLHTDAYLVPEIVYEPLPSDAVWSPAENAILQEAFWPENFGHAIGDDFFSAYHLARSFGAWDRSDMQIIMHPACSDRGSPHRACANHAKIAPYVLDRPLETANSTLFTSEAGPRVCFRNLYTGMRELGTSYPSKNVMPQFIQEFRKTAGLSATSTPGRQRITVFLKEGRRIFLNNDALVEHLRQRFDVEVDLMDPSKLSISEQLAYLQDTTVLVSPCGGISYGQFFLSKGASMVVADYWHLDKNANRTMPMEPFVFQHNNNVETFYYPLEWEDLQLDRSVIPPDGGGTEFAFYRNYANLTVNLDRMEKYVFSGVFSSRDVA